MVCVHAYDLQHLRFLKANRNVGMNKRIVRFVTETRREDGNMHPPKAIAYNWHVQSDHYELTMSGGVSHLVWVF